MSIDHLAIWVKDLKKMKQFYLRLFEVNANEKYHNAKKQFSSYFLSLGSSARIELMHRPDISDLLKKSGEQLGLAHLAISVGGKEQVDALTEQIRENGYPVIGEPRTTGDGYYESVVADPEGNRIEITI